MKDHVLSDHSKIPGTSGRPQPVVKERRAAARKPIITTAQVVELASGARLKARSCDLVIHGCYVDTLNPFPTDTLVRIRLEKGRSSFEANGRVVYRLTGLGMGIAFLDMTPENKVILETWLSSAHPEGNHFEASLHPLRAELSKPEKPDLADQMTQLVQLLRRKGLLTKAEAFQLLKDHSEEEAF